VKKKCRFPSWVRVPGQSTWVHRAVLFLFLNYSLSKVLMVSRLQSQRDCLVCEGGALYRSYQGCSMHSRDSLVGLDLLPCSFTFAIALTDVKKNSSTFIPLVTIVLALSHWIGQRRRRFARSQTRSVKHNNTQPNPLRA